MDSLRGEFGDRLDLGSDFYDPAEDDIGHEPPPAAIGLDERRMQVRAYNFWASLLGDRLFPSSAGLATGELPDFDPYSVLLDFTGGIENPAIKYLGDKLAEECGASPETIRTLADVPSRSLLSRITDHYLQIHANQAPIGFEAEFVNSLGRTILYRGILLPFSRDEDSTEIDQIYGVINWKELADKHTTAALLDEVKRVLDGPPLREAGPMTEWADGPADVGHDVLELVTPLDEVVAGDWDDEGLGDETFDYGDEDSMSLADWLASARELAQTAQGSEDRSRQALYAAIGRAWDFALAAAGQPEDFSELVADAGLTMQERAPYTPVVKLVFGAGYDKTRLTEYASAMSHAQRQGIGRGQLADFLSSAPGGLKGVVQAERRLRREESGKPAGHRESQRDIVSRQLRELPTFAINDLSSEGEEFSVVVIRRTADGQIVLVGEVTDDALLERASKRLIG